MSQSENREKILHCIEKLTKIYPDWRFGQLVANVSYWAKGATKSAIWDVNDEEFYNAAMKHIEKKSNDNCSEP